MTDDRLIVRRKGRAAAISYFVDEARTIDPAELAGEYNALKVTAPRRTRNYLEPARSSQATQSATRSEERLAATLVTRGQRLFLADGTVFQPIDFQVPLKAVRADALVGKIDLLAVADRLVVVELKVARGGGAGDTPLSALLEALSYAAIVEANHARFLHDCRMWDLRPTHPRPGLMVLGDARYWQYWDRTPAAEGWRSALAGFVAALEQTIGLVTWVAALPHDYEALPPGPVQLTDALTFQPDT